MQPEDHFTAQAAHDVTNFEATWLICKHRISRSANMHLEGRRRCERGLPQECHDNAAASSRSASCSIRLWHLCRRLGRQRAACACHPASPTHSCPQPSLPAPACIQLEHITACPHSSLQGLWSSALVTLSWHHSLHRVEGVFWSDSSASQPGKSSSFCSVTWHRAWKHLMHTSTCTHVTPF